MDKKITCRPCKEKNNWEIENEFGVVLEKHYKTKDACVKAGQKLADECHCELCVCDTTSCSNEKGGNSLIHFYISNYLQQSLNYAIILKHCY